MSWKKIEDFPKSFLKTLKKTDYNQWQRLDAAKKTTVVKVFLPPVTTVSAKKEDKNTSAPKDQPTGQKSYLASRLKNVRARRGTTAASEVIFTKRMANIRILQRLCKAKRNSLEEMKHHSCVLLERNQKLRKDIQEKDAETAQQARDLLQQYDMFGTIITTLQDSSQNQVGVAKAKLKEAENMVEKNMGKLEQELSLMNTKVGSLQEELNVLRTYMDKEYPVKSVQIVSLLRHIQNLREEQQDELEDTEEIAQELRKRILKKTNEETERILQDAIEKRVSKYYAGVKQMAKNNQALRQQIQWQKEKIAKMEKQILALQKETVVLHESIRHPRELIFEDVLLRKPKCEPDMEVILNIPTEEDLPL